MRFVLSAACLALFASAFLIGCGGDRGQSASTSVTTIPVPTTLGTASAPNVDGPMPATSAGRDHQPPPRTPEN